MKNDKETKLKALANGHRLEVLRLLKDPERNFPPQVDGDLVKDGVCAIFIEEKLGLAQPTTAQHLKALVDAGFLIPKRIKKWTFYKRDEAAIALFLDEPRGERLSAAAAPARASPNICVAQSTIDGNGHLGFMCAAHRIAQHQSGVAHGSQLRFHRQQVERSKAQAAASTEARRAHSSSPAASRPRSSARATASSASARRSRRPAGQAKAD